MARFFAALLFTAAEASAVPSLAGKCGVVVHSKAERGRPAFTPAMLRSGVAAGLQWHTFWEHWGRPLPGFEKDYSLAHIVPQFWGAVDYDFPKIEPPAIPVMLGFNEPDQKSHGGSGVGVQRALTYWMKLVARARGAGYTEFVAPSIAKALPSRYTHKAGGSEWLPRFLEACLKLRGCNDTITYLGFHLYEPNCGASESVVTHWNMEVRVGSLKRLMEDFNARGMAIKGLWLTEFAGRSERSGRCRTRQQQLAWMRLFLPKLHDEPAVVAYSWFSYGEGRSRYFEDDANLWNYTTGELNELGQEYFRLCRMGFSRRLGLPQVPVVVAGAPRLVPFAWMAAIVAHLLAGLLPLP